MRKVFHVFNFINYCCFSYRCLKFKILWDAELWDLATAVSCAISLPPGRCLTSWCVRSDQIKIIWVLKFNGSRTQRCWCQHLLSQSQIVLPHLLCLMGFKPVFLWYLLSVLTLKHEKYLGKYSFWSWTFPQLSIHFFNFDSIAQSPLFFWLKTIQFS